jgi:hypothetical protein
VGKVLIYLDYLSSGLMIGTIGARLPFINSVRNYAEDEGRPLGAGLQEQALNHLKLHRSRAVVVSVKEKL